MSVIIELCFWSFFYSIFSISFLEFLLASYWSLCINSLLSFLSYFFFNFFIFLFYFLGHFFHVVSSPSADLSISLIIFLIINYYFLNVPFDRILVLFHWCNIFVTSLRILIKSFKHLGLFSEYTHTHTKGETEIQWTFHLYITQLQQWLTFACLISSVFPLYTHFFFWST